MTGGTAVREISITRVFEAPRELVWRAWTEPERLARWWGKRGWSTPPESVTIELWPGGAFRLNSICDADGREMPLDATVREVMAPRLLAFGGPHGAGATVTLDDLGAERTEMVFHTTIEATAAILDSARGGLRSAFDRLAELVEHPDHDQGSEP